MMCSHAGVVVLWLSSVDGGRHSASGNDNLTGFDYSALV